MLGNAYALFGENQGVFTSMLITNEVNKKIDTLYRIYNITLISKKGLDAQVSKEKFSGYKCILKKQDYIVLVIVDKYGKEISDYLTIRWSYEENLFELLKSP